MKRLAIIASQYFWLPSETGPSRLYFIAGMLREAGYEVDVITSSFEHYEKRQRSRSAAEPFRIIYLTCPSYRKNVGPAREISNLVFTRKISAYLKKYGKRYDAVYCTIPPNNIAAAVGKFCRENRKAFIVDIEDLWPEAMYMVFPKLLRGIFAPYKMDAEKAYRYADAVVGTSDQYSLRASKYNGRRIPYATVYVGTDIDTFDRDVREHIGELVKPEGEIWLTYAGTISHSYAVDNLMRTAKCLQDRGENRYRFKILGGGPFKPDVESLAGRLGCRNVDFMGYLDHPLMSAYLAKSDILINSFAKGAPQSITNKIGDYLAAGKAMINTLENDEMCRLVSDYGIGINVEAENAEKLCMAILSLTSADEDYKAMGIRARKLAELQFDRKIIYPKITELLRSLTEG